MGKLSVGEVICSLRKDRKLTQEQLAGFIGVSAAAISKWESGASYPDITMLPLLSDFFNVSIDRLMNHRIELSEDEVMTIYRECERCYCQGQPDDAYDKCKEYLSRHSGSWLLKFRLAFLMKMYAWKWMDEEMCHQMLLESIGINEEIVANCPEKEIVELALFQLGSMYPSIGESQKAMDALQKLKPSQLDPTQLLASIYIDRRELEKARGILQVNLYQHLQEAVSACMFLANTHVGEETLGYVERYYQLALQLRAVVDRPEETSDKQWNTQHTWLSFAMEYLHLAELYAKRGQIDKVYSMLESMLSDLRRNDINKPVDFHKIWCFHELKPNAQRMSMNLYENLLLILDQSMFDEIRGQQRFQKIVNELIKLKQLRG